MTELPLIFLGGLLGSSHCIGMCGPLALALGVTEERFVANLRRQLVFSIGRILTYGFGGALAAYAGWWLGRWPAAAFNVQAVLAIVAGAALVLLGLSGAGSLATIAIWPIRSTNLLCCDWFENSPPGAGTRISVPRRSLYWLHSMRLGLRLLGRGGEHRRRHPRMVDHGRIRRWNRAADGARRQWRLAP